jgi:glucose-6-phosphate 1-dehydrogenase
VIEKPFGHDLASAKALNAEILKTLSERQIYRIDHFLGKETVQNVMALRFANGIFEPIWNRAHIDHIQITAAETVGVERRGKFYERTGALRAFASQLDDPAHPARRGYCARIRCQAAWPDRHAGQRQHGLCL